RHLPRRGERLKADTTGRLTTDARATESAQAPAGAWAATRGARAPLSPDEPATVVEVVERAMRVHPRPDTLNYKREGRWHSISSDDLLLRERRARRRAHPP